uniref:ribosomal protein S16 n=1 Tax=Streptofilum capillatum TaxID=2058781 RepID=UPI00286C8267|nr:ribosomal protein S16 [Streptofilum capillatum]WKT08574.1 ribosomal protein S16 [Streptofilum capillatum]WKT08673.1 ribosomal protein S16 [Streptofilum sp. BC4-VF8pt]WKT08772.1 ribosomal protein S16 [Streptofilum sp. ZNP2-VF4pt]
MVKLRLKRCGRKQQPTYRIIAIDSKSRREGRPLKELGYYNPLNEKTQFNLPEIVYYLKNGAQPTDTVRHILNKAQVFSRLKLDLNENF